MGKGSRQRTLNSSQFNDNYDRIYGDNRNERSKRVPQEKGEEYSSERDTKTKQDKTV